MNKNGYVLHMLREKFRRSFRFELLGRAKAFSMHGLLSKINKHCVHASPRSPQSVFREFRVEKVHVRLKWLR